MAIERTFLAVKPDGVKRRLIPEIIKRLEQRGYTMIAAKLLIPSEELLTAHYIEHEGKPFLPGLIKFMASGPVFAMIWEGESIIAEARRLMGATRPTDAQPGTIRFDFAQCTERNIIHGSDSKESALREMNLWFNKSELCDYESGDFCYALPSCCTTTTAAH